MSSATGKRAAAMLLLAAVLGPLGCADPERLPTVVVERRPFHQRVTAEGVLEAAEVTPLTLPPEVRRSVRLAWLAADGTILAAGDLVARFDPTAMEQMLEAGQMSLESATLEVGKARIEGEKRAAKHETQLAVADLELAHVRRYQKVDEEIFSRHEIVEAKIDAELAKERKGHAEGSLEIEAVLQRTELEILAIKQRRAQLDIDQAEEGLASLEIRAPHAGVLTLARGWRGEVPQVGSEMWRGQPIGEIPDLAVMEAEVYVLEADAGGLAIGKPVSVVLEAHPSATYSGAIRRIDTVAKPRLPGSPVQYFGVTVALDATIPELMKPGQRVRATLHLAELDDAIVLPRQAIQRRGGQPFALVEEEHGVFRSRPVVLGASSMGLVVVSDGLAAGEVVALRPPLGFEDDAASAASAEQGPEES